MSMARTGILTELSNGEVQYVSILLASILLRSARLRREPSARRRRRLSPVREVLPTNASLPPRISPLSAHAREQAFLLCYPPRYRLDASGDEVPSTSRTARRPAVAFDQAQAEADARWMEEPGINLIEEWPFPIEYTTAPGARHGAGG